jgi:hypothetical protein
MGFGVRGNEEFRRSRSEKERAQSLARRQKGALQKKRAYRTRGRVPETCPSQKIEQMLANGLAGLLVGGEG